MKILVDSHIFLWAIAEDPRLTKRHRAYYLDEDNTLFLSVASIWEILIKAQLRKLHLPTPTVDFLTHQLDANRLSLLPVRMSHLAALEQLAPLHRDPFDRMIVAQAIAERIPLLTADPALRKYGAKLL